MPDPSSMFDRLAQNRQKTKAPQPAPAPAPVPAPEPKTRKRRATGKRSDPNYIQVGAYIPKSLNKAVKRHLLDSDRDFSELIAELLNEWVEQQND